MKVCRCCMGTGYVGDITPIKTFVGDYTLPPQQGAILHVLQSKESATYRELIGAMGTYGWKKDEIDNPILLLKVQVAYLRRTLEKYGQTIINIRNYGYALRSPNDPTAKRQSNRRKAIQAYRLSQREKNEIQHS